MTYRTFIQEILLGMNLDDRVSFALQNKENGGFTYYEPELIPNVPGDIIIVPEVAKVVTEDEERVI